jgi:hypothetical protein
MKLNWFDWVVTGAWWWRLRQRVEMWRLEKVLVTYGEDSIEANDALERFRRIDFAERYWRQRTADIHPVIYRLEAAGVDLNILRLLVVNLDLRWSPSGKVIVRRGWVFRILGWVVNLTVPTHAFLLTALVAVTPAELVTKVTAIIGICVLYSMGYRIMSIYSGHPARLAQRYGQEIEVLANSCPEQRRGSLRSI